MLFNFWKMSIFAIWNNRGFTDEQLNNLYC